MLDSGNRPAAVFSADGRYRYLLTRRTGFDERVANFIMLNPSTADAVKNDPTVRRCIGFANAWDFGWLHVTNLSPFRATHPRDLRKAGPEPEDVWDENLRTILETGGQSDLVVAAWGVHGEAEGRAEKVLAALWEASQEVHCLGTTKEGQPLHPLYLAAATEPRLFRSFETLTPERCECRRK